MTGMLMFVHKGSLIQVVAALVVSVSSLLSIALLQPYNSPAANMFKVGTELALLVTLIIVVLLKIDLGREDVDDPEFWIAVLGSILVFVNTLVPSAGLGIGVMFGGFDALEVAMDTLDQDEVALPDKKKPKDKKKKEDKKRKKDKKDTNDALQFNNPLDDDHADVE